MKKLIVTIVALGILLLVCWVVFRSEGPHEVVFTRMESPTPTIPPAASTISPSVLSSKVPNTGSPKPSATPTHTPQITIKPTPTPTPIKTPDPTPIITREPTPVPTPISTPTPERTPTPTPLPTPTPTPVPSPTPTPVPTPTPTPSPTPTPTPTPTPATPAFSAVMTRPLEMSIINNTDASDKLIQLRYTMHKHRNQHGTDNKVVITENNVPYDAHWQIMIYEGAYVGWTSPDRQPQDNWDDVTAEITVKFPIDRTFGPKQIRTFDFNPIFTNPENRFYIELTQIRFDSGIIINL